MAVILSRGLSLQWSSWTGPFSPSDCGCGKSPLNAQHFSSWALQPADAFPSSHPTPPILFRGKKCVYKKDAHIT